MYLGSLLIGTIVVAAHVSTVRGLKPGNRLCYFPNLFVDVCDLSVSLRLPSTTDQKSQRPFPLSFDFSLLDLLDLIRIKRCKYSLIEQRAVFCLQ